METLDWFVLDREALIEKHIYDIEVNNIKICIVLINNILYAFQSKCPHSGAPFSEGFLDKSDCLVCPLHKYKFKLSNGYNVTGEGYKLKTYPTKLGDDHHWYIGLKKGDSNI